jgi:hypothetical protein
MLRTIMNSYAKGSLARLVAQRKCAPGLAQVWRSVFRSYPRKGRAGKLAPHFR